MEYSNSAFNETYQEKFMFGASYVYDVHRRMLVLETGIGPNIQQLSPVGEMSLCGS